MEKQREILSAFLRSALAGRGLTLDESALNAIHQNLELIERPGDENQQTRTVRLEQDSTGKFSAASIKLYNIVQISPYELLGFLIKETGVLMFEETAQKVIYGLIALLHEFYPKLKVSFNEQEAKVLFTIARLEKNTFSTPELGLAFQQNFGNKLPEDRLEASLEVLVEHRVIERTAAKKYRRLEKIKNLRRSS